MPTAAHAVLGMAWNSRASVASQGGTHTVSASTSTMRDSSGGTCLVRVRGRVELRLDRVRVRVRVKLRLDRVRVRVGVKVRACLRMSSFCMPERHE
eukprot:scaffold53635_cov75-Phaeocystis_antarctica.AAC.3